LINQHICYLRLGSNLEEPKKQLLSGMKAISDTPDISFIATSSFYLSTPLDNTNQALFWNIVIKIETSLSPEALLEAALNIEEIHHRVRAKRWGPRTLDIDILLYDTRIINSPSLSIPHKEMLNRDFVLVPLAEIEPNLCLPNGTALHSHLEILKKNIIEKHDLILS
jgi:2-amino-4-hydroxy-6-hydroxymethyldihydropteridine diphosphokinase